MNVNRDRLLFAVPALLAVIGAGFVAAQWARAYARAAQNTQDSLAAAIRLVPGNAAWRAQAGDFAGAVALNPYDAESWSALAVAREQDGDSAGAEAALLRAAAASRYYRTRWTLAYFYYRHRDLAAYRRWMRAALEMKNGETRPLFEMAQKLGIERAAIAALVPEECDALADYLDFEVTGATAMRLIRRGCRENLGSVLGACDFNFAHGNADVAVDIWNRISQAGWIPLPGLRPTAGVLLANPSFSPDKVTGGFDWREAAPQGALVERSATGDGLRVEFTGKQPERCELISLNVPALPGQRYRLTAEYRGTPVAQLPGLQWSADPLGTAPAGVPLEFTVPEGGTPVRLRLTYGRIPGTTRIEGVLRIASVRLELLAH
jgi:hypothetical protein